MGKCRKMLRNIKNSFIHVLCGESLNGVRKETWISSELARIEKGKSILDAGAGELKWKEACSHLKYVSQDFCEYNGAGNSQGFQIGKWDTTGIDIVSDITNIPVENNSFDVILCSEVFEHIPYPEKAIKEFSRILKPGGILLLTAPFWSLTHFAPYHFATGFNKYWYEKCLGDYGFSIEVMEANGGYFDYYHSEISQIPSVARRYLGKSSLFLRINCVILTALLRRMIKEDKNSAELLTYGYMVRAVKL